MVWWTKPVELKNSTTGFAINKWRLIAYSDESFEMYEMCEHEHSTPEEAKECFEAKTESKKFLYYFS